MPFVRRRTGPLGPGATQGPARREPHAKAPKAKPAPSFEESMRTVAKTVRKAKVNVERKPTVKQYVKAHPQLIAQKRQQDRKRAEKHAKVTAPAVSVLNQTLRPIRAIAGASDEALRGHPQRAPKAVARGLVKNKGPLFGDVLKHAGAPKGVAAVGGFALDVAADPTTYLTAGASIPAKAVARQAAIKATAEAASKGASKKAADRAGRAAAKAKLTDPKHQNKGLTVGARVPFTGKQVSTSGKTTAAVSRQTGASKAATKVRESRFVQAVGPELVHDFRSKGVTPAAHDRTRAAQRELRAQTAKARRETDRETKALRTAIPDAQTAHRIIDHVESDRPLSELGTHAPTARAIRRMLGESFDAKRAAGLLQRAYRPGQRAGASKAELRSAKARVSRARRGVDTARRREAKVTGRTEVLATQADRRVLNASKPYREAAKKLTAAKREMKAARIAHHNAHYNEQLYPPAERIAKEQRAQAAEIALKEARLDFNAIRASLAQQAQQGVTKAAGQGQKAEGVARLGRVPTRTLASQERAGGRVLAARDEVRRAKADLEQLRSKGVHIDPLAAATEAQRYLPRVRRMDLEATRKGVLKRKTQHVRVSPEKARTLREPMSVYRNTMSDLFSDDLPATIASHRLGAKEKVATANFWRKVSTAGRPLNDQTARDIDLSHEMVFEVTPRGLEPLVKEGGEKLDLARLQRALKGDGKHVVLDHDNYERLARSATDNRTVGGKAFDKAQGTWKTVVTVPMPSYHARNLVGDSMNAFLADTTARSGAQAVKVLASRVSRNRAQGRTLAAADTSKTITVAGRRYTHRQLLDEAERHGAIDQGFIAHELPYETQRKAGPITRAAQYREDAPRLATYISARNRGVSPSQAADWAARHHFDYGDLTTTERAVRRAIPFYTFFARNSRLQATKVFTRPGKQATLAKILEESARAAGFKDYEAYVQDLPEYQQNGLPIPVKVGGEVTSWVFNPPTTDVRVLTTNLPSIATNIAQRLTAAKLVGELWANKSIFFQGPIERENAKLVPAPAILGELPANVRTKIGVEKYTDKRRGLIWGWPAKVDYTARQLPETNLLVAQLTPVPGSRQQSRGQALTGALTGVKPTTYATSVEDERIRRQSQKLHELTTERNNLLKTPAAVNREGYASPKLARLRRQITAQEETVKRLKAQRGDDTVERRVKLSPQDEIRKEVEDFTRGASDTRKLQDEVDAFFGAP